jgi:hypothetical protein
MMPLPVCRKTRTMEKVEILYRTARAQNDSIDTSRHIGSRLRDGETSATLRRTPPLSHRKVGALAATSEQS